MAEQKTMSEEAKFEDGKQVEDYLGELNEVEQTLAIEKGPSPEATARIEDVAQPPVRNKSEKKSEAKKQAQPKPTPTVSQPVASKPATTQAIADNPQPQTSPQPPVQAPTQLSHPAEQPTTSPRRQHRVS